MPNIVTIDFETFFDRQFSLSKITTEDYCRSPLFEVIGVGIKVNDAPAVWYPQPQVEAALAAIDWSDTFVLCQNTAFDAAILSWRYRVNPRGWLDTLGMSRALYPHEKSHSLKSQAERLRIGVKGEEVVAALGMRYKDFGTEALRRYGDYCENDCELTYKLFQKYMATGFPRQELELIDLTLRMFTDPVFRLNAEKLTAHLRSVRDKKQALLDQVRDSLLEGADTATIQAVFAEGDAGLRKLLMSGDRFATALKSQGVEPPTKISPTTGKTTWAFAKTDEEFKALEDHNNPDVQALVAARLGTKSTIEETRTQTLLGYAGRGAFPIALRYYGSLTGRWSAESSAKVNMQNLPRASKIKEAIEAPEGYVICGADLSNIELRLGLWLAEQDDRVQMLAEGTDLYKDFSKDVFRVAYEEVTKEQRQVGKVSNLSLIYGTGAAKLREALRIMGGVRITLDEAKPIVDLYRSRYFLVAQAWAQGEMALRAIARGQSMSLFRGGICQVEGNRGIRLPSGLHLQYPNLRRITNDKGKGEWVFDSKYGLERVYGAKVFQACTQAIARCIMGEGLLRIQKFTPVRLTIHDAAYWMAPDAEAEVSLARGIACITAPIRYCPGLPLAAEGAYGKTLADC